MVNSPPDYTTSVTIEAKRTRLHRKLNSKTGQVIRKKLIAKMIDFTTFKHCSMW